jgi:hypothetical protein
VQRPAARRVLMIFAPVWLWRSLAGGGGGRS